MRSPRLRGWLARQHWVQSLQEELVLAPIEPILHASPLRLWWLGLSFFLGNLLFAWIWSVWLPQPYENIGLRVVGSLLGYGLMTRLVREDPGSRLTQRIFSIVFWLELPVMFTWMYLCNGESTVWLATLSAMVLIYYHVTDWRLATLGTISGSLAAWLLFINFGPDIASVAQQQWPVHAVVLAFAWSIALVLNLSSASLRREQLARALSTMGIMAHELRTPLSTISLLSDAIHLEVARQPGNPRGPYLDKFGTKLHALVRTMNHQIDTQIANARLLQLPRHYELVSAGQLVVDAVTNYPFSADRQRECVAISIKENFDFYSSATQFSQVLDNLIKNALHALAAADSQYPPGALAIEVDRSGTLGCITIKDKGTGIAAAVLDQIFKPFFSSNRGTGHGLGLAFCQQVVLSAGGSIDVRSVYGDGASFIIYLPVVH